MSTMSTERMPVGIRGLDPLIDGGLPRGASTLVVGTTGTGKTVFGLQYLAEGVRRYGENGVLVTFEEDPQDLLHNASSFEWGIGELVAEGKVTIVNLSPEDEVHAVEGDVEFGGLIARIELAVRETGAKRVVLDSIGALFPQFLDGFVVRRELRRVIRALRALGVTAIMTAERSREDGPVSRFEVEDFVVDSVLLLRHVLEHRTRRRTVEVLKLRGGTHRKGEFPFTIDARVGMEVIPLTALTLDQPASDRRAPTGNSGLDEMCGGGYMQDSVVLLSGATGIGKSLLTYEFVTAAAAAGERALMYSFEESRNQLLRNAANWGVDIAGAEQSGLLRIVVRRPERLALEELLLDIRADIEEFAPSRVAVDSLTALERSAGPDAFRDFVVALINYVKEREIVAVFTNTSPLALSEDSVTASHISTMTDVILLLRYVEAQGRARRGLMVLKMRGSRHDTDVRELVLSSEGSRLADSLGNVRGFLPGAPAVDGAAVFPPPQA